MPCRSRLRPHRACTFLALVAGSVLAAATAEAQDADGALSSRHVAYASPQHFEAELRFAPFTPAIDSDPSLHGATPYATVFGTSPRILVSAELDWQIFRFPHFGTLGPGLGVGYTAMSAPALFASPHGPTQTLVSGETTSLDIFPFDAVAVLRVDVLWRDVGIPIVPYLKAGLGMSLWRATNTLGTSVYTTGTGQSVAGEGHSIGTHFAVGIGFNLNVLDEYAARSWDEAMGVNGTYLFAEYAREDLDGLGFQSDPLRVGGTSWNFGLAFEF
jgi:hypothetical protein